MQAPGLLLSFLHVNCSSAGFAEISWEALIRVWTRDLWWDPLDGLGGGALGALGLRGQALRRVRTVHLAVHQGKVDIIHVWHHKYFLEDNQKIYLWAPRPYKKGRSVNFVLFGSISIFTWNSSCSFFSIHSVTWQEVTSLSPSLGRTCRSNLGGAEKLYLHGGTSRNTVVIFGSCCQVNCVESHSNLNRQMNNLIWSRGGENRMWQT